MWSIQDSSSPPAAKEAQFCLKLFSQKTDTLVSRVISGFDAKEKTLRAWHLSCTAAKRGWRRLWPLGSQLARTPTAQLISTLHADPQLWDKLMVPQDMNSYISKTLFSCSSLDFLSSISQSLWVPSSTTSCRAMSSTSCRRADSLKHPAILPQTLYPCKVSKMASPSIRSTYTPRDI